jgi:hypothetical protein
MRQLLAERAACVRAQTPAVNDREFSLVGSDAREIEVSRRTRDLTHDSALSAGNPIEQRRLADIRPPTDENRRQPL